MNTLLQKKTDQHIGVIEILQGNQALMLTADQGFQSQWDTLYTSCPWATVFQSRQFVYTWYHCYQRDYMPLLVVSYSGDKLVGLLTLAQDERGQLFGAGANQAEYQVWLSTEKDASEFIKKALTVLLEKFPQSEISLKFVPGNTPLQWLQSDPLWQKICFQRTVKQPLLLLNKENLSQELRKKNRREKLNRLKRQGQLSFARVTDRVAFSSVLDELTVQSDFRKGAMYNKRVFQEDSYRKEFMMELFDEGLLHVTLLKVDEEIIASNVGVTGKNWVHLQGINTHSPMQAKHSPGILHFLMLGVMLAEEGIEVFDLTPGNDPYKESLATDFTHATELIIGRPATILNKKLNYRLATNLKHTLTKLGMEQRQIRQLSHQITVLKDKTKLIKPRHIPQLLKTAVRDMVSSPKVHTFRLPPASDGEGKKLVSVSRDCLYDLLCYAPTASLTSKWEFLIDAMRRLETGQHAYTWQEDGHLLGCAWLSEPKAARPEAFSKVDLPAEACLLHSFHCPFLDQHQTSEFMRSVVASVTENSDLPLYAITDTSNSALYDTLKLLQSSSLDPNNQFNRVSNK